MSAFAEVLKASPEYKTLEKAVKSKNYGKSQKRKYQ